MRTNPEIELLQWVTISIGTLDGILERICHKQKHQSITMQWLAFTCSHAILRPQVFTEINE